MNDIRCPYCGSAAVLRSGTYVFKHHAPVEYLYVCSKYPACDSYVNIHKDTMLPQGTLANAE